MRRQCNYDAKGNVLPQGAGVSRNFVDHDYEFYGQDSWKILRNLTVTAGLRFTYSPSVYDANGERLARTFRWATGLACAARWQPRDSHGWVPA
jgi:hypothetical protein